jgi:anthranilate phosphoribosyltransferase
VVGKAQLTGLLITLFRKDSSPNEIKGKMEAMRSNSSHMDRYPLFGFLKAFITLPNGRTRYEV